MGNWKEILTRSLIIMLAALLIVVGYQMLASEQITNGANLASDGEVLVEEGPNDGETGLSGDMPAFMGYVMSFVKEILFMGIPFAITLGALALVRKIGRQRNPRAVPKGVAS